MAKNELEEVEFELFGIACEATIDVEYDSDDNPCSSVMADLRLMSVDEDKLGDALTSNATLQEMFSDAAIRAMSE